MTSINNLYYFKYIYAVGGIETFLWQLVKRFPNTITILCDGGDLEQIRRLNKYANVLFYQKGVKIKCDKAFFNFNLDAIDDIEANEYNLVVHGNYKWFKNNVKPPINPKINNVYAVSKDSAKAYTELTGIPCEVMYNPIDVEKKPSLMLLSATRLDFETDNIKGVPRMIELKRSLDRYCEINNCCYEWHVYSNKKHELFNTLNPQLDITQFMNRYDYVIQLSDNVEGFNYTINESLVRGVPVVVTPCDVYKELGVNKNMAIFLDFDCSNIDSVVDKMFTASWDFKYKPPESKWKELLNLKKEKVIPIESIKVKATEKALKEKVVIAEFKGIPNKNDISEMEKERAIKLEKMGYVEIV